MSREKVLEKELRFLPRRRAFLRPTEFSHVALLRRLTQQHHRVSRSEIMLLNHS